MCLSSICDSESSVLILYKPLLHYVSSQVQAIHRKDSVQAQSVHPHQRAHDAAAAVSVIWICNLQRGLDVFQFRLHRPVCPNLCDLRLSDCQNEF